LSRVGKNPVEIPKGVTVTRKGDLLAVKGPKGELKMDVSDLVKVEIEKEQVVVTRSSDAKDKRSMHGTTRAIIQNMVIGVTDGFKKNLELVGVGYRAEMRGRILFLNLGFSHPIALFAPTGIEIAAPTQTTISIAGTDKQLVGQIAAKVRSLRPPEPYKGKGVKYEGEHVRRKAGKTAKA